MDTGLFTSPRYTFVGDVPAAVYAHIFAAAAELYRLTPWVTLGEEVPFEIRRPPGAPGRVVVVTGAAGDVYGLSVYDSAHDLKRMFKAGDPMEIVQNLNWVTLCYESPAYIDPDDLETILANGWLLANETAYPVINRMGAPGAELYPPAIEDLLWLEAALPALNEFFRAQGASTSTGGVKPQELTLNVQTSTGPAQVELRIPAQEIGSG